jgi:lipoprotein-anchoring transpeptidase ErfK/SrfK
MYLNKKAVSLFIIIFLFLLIEGIGLYIGTRSPQETREKVSKQNIFRLRSQNQYLKNRIQGLVPEGIHVVVDSGNNRLFLKKGYRVIREAIISCGSGAILKDPKNKRGWVFDTPHGVFSVQTKYIAPVWTKPDWAFIEEGEKIPTTMRGRMEPGVLGDYSLGFGNGYYIHGTLYTRLLGRNVTHGCIRLGDEDLKALFAAVDIGTKIFIF